MHTHACIIASRLFTSPPAPVVYRLSLHAALPICAPPTFDGTITAFAPVRSATARIWLWSKYPGERDRKSTRLNSSHVAISYAVCCLKKKIVLHNRSIFQHHNHSPTLRDYILMDPR